MYVNVHASSSDRPPLWVGCRGTSALEGFHKHFHSLLPGCNNSWEHFDTLVKLFMGRWNERQSRRAGAAWHGVYDYTPLQRINKLCAELGLRLPYPEAIVPEPRVGEKMGFAWSELEPSTAAGVQAGLGLLKLFMLTCRH